MRTAYVCAHCDGFGHAGFDTPVQCLEHEKTCAYNPTNRTCSTCRHFDFATRPEHDNWKPPGTGTYEHEDDIPQPMGCHVYNDQVYRTQCEKWERRPA